MYTVLNKNPIIWTEIKLSNSSIKKANSEPVISNDQVEIIYVFFTQQNVLARGGLCLNYTRRDAPNKKIQIGEPIKARCCFLAFWVVQQQQQ